MDAIRIRPFAAASSMMMVLLLSVSAGGQPPPDKPKFTNRLAKETSPYLLMHSHNPTNWYAWGPEAFEKAKKEGKLIFLSIGYSSCYWCHVMERESFNNEDVAKILNDSFVCIKVDREERPDIDHIYMTALTVTRQSGGWPLSMFILPDGRPIVGGTYWPPEDRKIEDETVRGFKSILAFIRDAYKDKPKEIEEQAEKVAAATVLALDESRGGALVELDRKLLAEAVDSLKEEFDPVYGGFGNPNKRFKGPKFPMPARLSFLLQQGERTGNKALIEMVGVTLDHMAFGGIYDQVGGGFHRYSTERTWNVPHFEKMLYDNAQLAEVFAHAYRLTKKPHYRRVLEETLAYVQREMMSPEGAFYSSQDAETHHEEGRFYVWTPQELAAALPDPKDLAFIQKVYAADPATFEGKYHILSLAKTPMELAKEMNLTMDEFYARLSPLRQKLFDSREKRDKPFLNKIALTAWSGQMIAGFAAAGMALNEPKYIATATKAADFVLSHQRTDKGRILRTYGAQPGQAPKAAVQGYLEDYAFLVHGLLNLHDATKEPRLLADARALTDTMIEFHGVKKSGGYYFTAHDSEKFFARSKDQFDGAQPSGNSIAARNLVRLWSKTGDEKYRLEAERTFQALAGSLKGYPQSLTALASALDLYIEATEKKK